MLSDSLQEILSFGCWPLMDGGRKGADRGRKAVSRQCRTGDLYQRRASKCMQGARRTNLLPSVFRQRFYPNSRFVPQTSEWPDNEFSLISEPPKHNRRALAILKESC